MCLNKESIPFSEIASICLAPLIWQCCMSQDCAQSLFLRISGSFFHNLFLVAFPQLLSISTPCVRGRSEEPVGRSQALCCYSFSFRNSKGEILTLLQWMQHMSKSWRAEFHPVRLSSVMLMQPPLYTLPSEDRHLQVDSQKNNTKGRKGKVPPKTSLLRNRIPLYRDPLHLHSLLLCPQTLLLT